MSRHRSPASRHPRNAAPSRTARPRAEHGARITRGTTRAPAHRHAAMFVAVAAVIAVVGSALSLNGIFGTPESDAGVNLASDDLAILPPAPALPSIELPEPKPEVEPAAPPTEEPDEEEAKDAAKADEDEKDDEGKRADKFPSELIDASNWYLTLPTGSEGSPDTVEASELRTYDSEYFRLNDEHNGVVFTANAGGVTTENSKYPRSELREMNGGEKAAWDGRSGTHVMELDQAITKTPRTKPDVIAGQIHGGDDDVMQIHLSGSQLTVKYADGDKEVVLDDSYRLGERFQVKIESSDGHVKVWHNGGLKADLPIYGAESYFKAGAYVNSNPSKGASASDVGQVVIYGLKISHSS